ncbi:hypothetical protein QTN25_007170 [Entamoeba marina]
MVLSNGLEHVSSRAAEILWLLCFMSFIATKSVSIARDAIVMCLFEGRFNVQKLPKLITFLQDTPLIRLQAMFDLVVRQRNNASMEMVKNNKLCLEVQMLDKAIFQGHTADCLIFFASMFDKRIELLEEIRDMETSAIGRDMEIRYSLVILLFKTMKMKEKEITKIKTIIRKLYPDDQELKQLLQKIDASFEKYMDLHNDIKNTCTSAKQQIGVVKKLCEEAKKHVLGLLEHVVHTVGNVTFTTIKKFHDNLLKHNVTTNPLFPVTPDDLSDIFQMYKGLNCETPPKRTTTTSSLDAKDVKIKNLQDMSTQYTNLLMFITRTQQTPRFTPRKQTDNRKSIIQTQKRRSIEPQFAVKRNNNNLLRTIQLDNTKSPERPITTPTTKQNTFPSETFPLEQNDIIERLMPRFSQVIESNNKFNSIERKNNTIQQILERIIELLKISDDASASVKCSDKIFNETKSTLEKLVGVYEWSVTTQMLITFEPPEPNDFLQLFSSLLTNIDQTKERHFRALQELKTMTMPTEFAKTTLNKVVDITNTFTPLTIAKTSRDIRKRSQLEEQRETQRVEYAKCYNDFVKNARDCLTEKERSKFTAHTTAVKAYKKLLEMNNNAVVGINRYVEYLGMEESLDDLYKKLVEKGFSTKQTRISDVSHVSFRLTDLSSLLRSPICITSCTVSSDLITAVYCMANEISSVSLELQGLQELTDKQQIDELTERYHKLCVKYRSSPALHLAWLERIISKHTAVGNYLEAGICEVQAAYYIFSANKLELGCINTSHITKVCPDFLIEKRGDAETPITFNIDLFVEHSKKAIELFNKAQMTWFGMEMCEMLREHFDDVMNLNELSYIHDQIAAIFASYENGDFLEPKFYLVRLWETEYIYASTKDIDEFNEDFVNMCDALGIDDIDEPQPVYPVVDDEERTVPTPSVTLTNTFSFESFEGDSSNLNTINAEKIIVKTQNVLPCGLRRSNIIKQDIVTLTPTEYCDSVVQRMIQSVSYLVCECEKNGPNTNKYIVELREYMTMIISEESFNATSIVKSFFPYTGEGNDAMDSLFKNLHRLKICCERGYNVYQERSQELEKTQLEFRSLYVLFMNILDKLFITEDD